MLKVWPTTRGFKKQKFRDNAKKKNSNRKCLQSEETKSGSFWEDDHRTRSSATSATSTIVWKALLGGYAKRHTGCCLFNIKGTHWDPFLVTHCSMVWWICSGMGCNTNRRIIEEKETSQIFLLSKELKFLGTSIKCNKTVGSLVVSCSRWGCCNWWFAK